MLTMRWLIAAAVVLLACGRTALVADAVVDAGPCAPSATKLKVSITLTADNHRRLFIDGRLIEDTTDEWFQPSSHVVELEADPGVLHVIAVEASNLSSQAGLDRGFLFELRSSRDVVVSDASWRVRAALPDSASWREAGFDDSAWSAAVAQAGNGSPPWGAVAGVTEQAQWLWSYRSDQVMKPNLETIALRRTFALAADGQLLGEACTR